jgi:fatty acid desaturase
VVIALVYNALFGLFLGMVFATNHLGRTLLPKNSDTDFLSRQVVTARNLRAHWLTDFCFGGRSCQIEHHLFTGLPRNKLRAAQQVVQPFCEKLGIDYHETGVVECYQEVLRHLENVSRTSRKPINGDAHDRINGY